MYDPKFSPYVFGFKRYSKFKYFNLIVLFRSVSKFLIQAVPEIYSYFIYSF